MTSHHYWNHTKKQYIKREMLNLVIISAGFITMINTISGLKDSAEMSEDKFYSDFLENALTVVPEVDYRKIYLIEDDRCRFVDANPAAVNFYGWSKDELKNMKITDINILTEACVKDEMRRAKEKKKFNFHFKHRTSRNEIKEVEVYSQPIRFGNKEYLYSIIHDLNYKRICC